MKIYELNISQQNDKGQLENFYYQKFYDPQEWKKIREVIKIVNEFPDDPKPFEFKDPIRMNIEVLNALTERAQVFAKRSGLSLNAELVGCINDWIKGYDQ